MSGDDIRILTAEQVQGLLQGRERELMETVRRAYEAHGDGASSLPHSTFLLFPDDPRNRIIALPAFLGKDFDVAGVKWISSFPGNHDRGVDRASAVVILNSMETGRPRAILEGSIISAKRTAASAALAAQYLHAGHDATRIGLIGCGLINYEITRFLLTVFPHARELVLYDALPERAERFGVQCQKLCPGIGISVVPDVQSVFDRASLVSFATTAGEPHVRGLVSHPGTTVLHISLRDLDPELILSADNVVDDADHVCRARTSIHLTEQQVGNREFIRCTLADITRGHAPARASEEGVTIFSPFGLGVLDMAVSSQVLALADVQNLGTRIESFLPQPWLER